MMLTYSVKDLKVSTWVFFFYNIFFKKLSLRKKCPYSALHCTVFSRIRTEYGEIQSISPHSVWMRENTDQKNSEYGHFSCSV